MANIFARSPYLIRIAETGQNGSKVELFLANGSFYPENASISHYPLQKDSE